MSQADIGKGPVLGQARMGAGAQSAALTSVAFSIKEFQPGTKQASMAEVDKLFSRAMDVTGPDNNGKLLWRIVKAQPAHEPTSIDEADVRQQVIADFKEQGAYEIAMRKARELVAQAQQIGLYEAAKPFGKSPTITRPLPREVIIDNLGPRTMNGQICAAAFDLYQWQQSGRKGPPPEAADLPTQWFTQTLRQPLFAAHAPPVLMVESEDDARTFLAEAYGKLTNGDQPTSAPATQPALAATGPALATSQPSTQPLSPTSAPAPADTITVITLPRERAAYVVQRVDFEPAYENDYLPNRQPLMYRLYMIRRHDLMMAWYSQQGPGGIFERMGYKPVAGQE